MFKMIFESDKKLRRQLLLLFSDTLAQDLFCFSRYFGSRSSFISDFFSYIASLLCAFRLNVFLKNMFDLRESFFLRHILLGVE